MESRFKAKSAATANIDCKVLRVHRRSMLQKSAREVTFDRRRNLQLSPLLDESAIPRISQSNNGGIAVKGQSTKPPVSSSTAQSASAKPPPTTNSRREMLKKWKEERELKRKENGKSSKRRDFKVRHVEHKDANLYAAVGGSKKREAKITTVLSTRPVTRSSTRLANLPTEATKKTSSTASSNTTVALETVPLRSSARRIATKAPATSTAAASSSRRNNIGKKQPVGKSGPATRGTATTSQVYAKKQNPFSVDLGRVSTKRGDVHAASAAENEKSFAPKGFEFEFEGEDLSAALPSTVPVRRPFKPLSPASANAFFGLEPKRRISTPLKKSNTSSLALFLPDVSVIRANCDSQSDDCAPAPVVPLYRTTETTIVSDDGKLSGARPKVRPSVRQNVNDRGAGSSSSSDSDRDQKSCKSRRPPRRSVSFAADPDEPSVKTPRNSFLSGRKSTPYIKSSERRVRIVDASEQNQVDMEMDQADNATPVMTRARKISERKPTPAVKLQDSEMGDEYDTPRLCRSRRQSGPNLAGDQLTSGQSELMDDDGEIVVALSARSLCISGKKQTPHLSAVKQEQNVIDDKEDTPRGRSRRPLGRRLTPAPKLASGGGEEMDVTPRRSRRVSARAATSMQDQKAEDSITKATDNHEKKDESEGERNLQSGEGSVAMEAQNGSVEQHDEAYFRRIVQRDSKMLNILCNKWDEVRDNGGISEDVVGQIFATVGKAQLLMKKKFGQFSGLIDDSEFHRGEQKVTCMDLQGFWDMVAIQVDNVQEMFNDLDELKNNNWQKEEVVRPKVQKKKKKKKTVVKKTKPVVVKSIKANEARAAAKKRLAYAKALMKSKFAEQATEKSRSVEVKTFDAGFFSVSSPVRHGEVGTPSNVTLASNRVTESSIGKMCSPAVSRLQQSPLATRPTNMGRNTRLRRSLLCQNNAQCVENGAKTDGDNFAKYLIPSIPVGSPASKVVMEDPPSDVGAVDQKVPVDGCSETEPTQQLQLPTMRSPLKTRQTAHCDAGYKSKSLSAKFSKIALISSITNKTEMKSENGLFSPLEKSTLPSSIFDDSINLMSFDSPSGQAKTSDSLTNGIFSPVQTQLPRRCTRQSTANPNAAIFSPL